jgi:hypothetical protein
VGAIAALVKLTYNEAILLSMDNKQIAKSTLLRTEYDEDDEHHASQHKILIKSVSKKRGVFFCPGSNVLVGQKDVEVGPQILEEDYNSGMFFMKHGAESSKLIDKFAAQESEKAKKAYVLHCTALEHSKSLTSPTLDLCMPVSVPVSVAGNWYWQQEDDPSLELFECHSKEPRRKQWNVAQRHFTVRTNPAPSCCTIHQVVQHRER